jgi:hypothetical protein
MTLLWKRHETRYAVPPHHLDSYATASSIGITISVPTDNAKIMASVASMTSDMV